MMEVALTPLIVSLVLFSCALEVVYYRFTIAEVQSIIRGEQDSPALQLAVMIPTVLGVFAPWGYEQPPLRRMAALGLYFLPFVIPVRHMDRHKWLTIIGVILWDTYVVRPLAPETMFEGYMKGGGAARWGAWLDEKFPSA
ncbi:hypothetical protein B0T11DRAFT_328329 [Plectosphaerella cucumerina]|uniref:Uncharacterized protein n=1 Tax=Plectosphaerella cucumerina TaxID=40658 RepID=A0A8K0X3J0_9PEZI|nr:hypothetical protein B0T11DRAFT_328329 [Plectosphaerella cucumerina]